MNGTFLSVRRGISAKEQVYMALGIEPDGRREILGFCIFGLEGGSARDLWQRGVGRGRIFITDDLPGQKEAIRKIFPEAE